jgi:catechol 2,3-dioxygenase-like lactoylglutathione lyase family enzyme
MPATGPDFISLQARDLDASQAFYEQYLGLVRSQAGPPHAVVFETKPIAFALRDVVPGTDLASVAQPGIGAAIWLHATDVQAIHDALVADGHTIVSAPIDGPFGRTSPSPTPTATSSLSTTAPDRPNATGRPPAPEDRGLRPTLENPGDVCLTQPTSF